MKTRRILALMLTMVLLAAMLPAGTPALAALTPSPWAQPEMNSANTSGLLTPSAARDFHSMLTRDEFCELVVEMVERTLGYALPIPATNPFTSDVEPISIHALKAWNYEIITGMTPTLFDPGRRVERQQLCAMMIRAIRGLERDLNRTFLVPGIAVLPYRDAAQIRDYAVEPVKLAYSNVIMQGDEQGRFMPDRDITSQECVAVIIRSFESIERTRVQTMTEAQRVELAVNRVHIGYAYGDSEYGVTQNLLLPTTSTGSATVTWSSSNTSAISINGSTGVVNTATAPRTVTLTATIRLGSTTRTKTFDLMTSQYTGNTLLMENAYNELNILYINDGDGESSVTGRIGLPTTVLGLPVTWQSSNPAVVNTEGIVSVPSGSETRYATLTATIRMGSQTRTKSFNLTVVNPAQSRGVTLHGIQLGMTQAQTAQLLGTVRRSITASNNETWNLYYSTNYTNFVTVAFIGDRAVAVYSMATNVASQLKNRAGAVITVTEANSMSGVSAVSYIDPGSASQQYAIMIYDSTSTIGSTARTLLAEGQEQLLFELINAFRQRNGRTTLEWTTKLGTPARTHSTNSGSGTLRQRVTSAGFDDARYAGGNIISGNGDAFDAFNQIVANATGNSAMRTEILQTNITLFGAGFYGAASGSYRNYFTYALGAVTPITGVTARQGSTNVTTVNVSTGSANAVSITLTMAPTGYNETFTVTSANTGIMTVSNVTAATGGATVTVTGVANGTANMVITGNCSGKTYNIPVSVGTVSASSLTLTYMSTQLSNSVNIAANTNATASGAKTLIMGTGGTLTIAATTTSGASVEWTRTGGTAATVARSTTTNDGVVTATSTAGNITLTARVQTGTNTYITHTITVTVISAVAANITLTPQTINVGGSPTTASITVTNPPATPQYSWTSSGNQLRKTSGTPETTTATFVGENSGTSTITFTATWSGSSAYLGSITRTATVTVQGNLYATDITVSQGSTVVPQGGTLHLIPGQTLTLTASTVPSAITQPHSYAWSSSHPQYAGFTSGGSIVDSIAGTSVTITAVDIGTTVVVVTLTQGAGPSQVFTVTVVVDTFPEITITPPGNIYAGSVVQINYTLQGVTGTLPDAYSISWEYTPDTPDSNFITPSGSFSAGVMATGTIIAELLYNGVLVDFDTCPVSVEPNPG